MLDEISGLDNYPYYHAARGAYLSDLHDANGAAKAYRLGQATATSEPQRRFFAVKLKEQKER
jgi:predicted RNA polymerase sigma factor